MKRRTVILLTGMDAYIVSCAAGVELNTAGIIQGLREHKVLITGKGRAQGDKIMEVKDVNGKPMISPNRASRIRVSIVEERRAFASLVDVSPIELKKLATPTGKKVIKYGHEWDVKTNERGTEYIDVELICDNPGCGGKIKGICRVNGDKVQGLIPEKKETVNQGKSWYCGCTTKPPIPKADPKPHHKGGTITVSFSGTIEQIHDQMIEYMRFFSK